MRVAAIQLNSTEDTDRNLATAQRLVEEAAEQGARLVVLPEKWSVLGTEEQMRAGAQTLDGEAVAWARSAARRHGLDLIAGSIMERRPGQEKLANTSLHIDPSGEISAVYRKIHMFDVELDGVIYAESEHEQPGEELALTTLSTGESVGMTICYDVRFPGLYQALGARGAKLFTIPSAFTLATSRDHWEVLLRARAIENQCFVIAPNQVGSHPPGHRSGGRSLIVDPWGIVLAGAADAENAIVAELDLHNLERIRRRLPVLQQRREEVYG